MGRDFKEFSKDMLQWVVPLTKRTLVYEAVFPNIEFDLEVLWENCLAREFIKKWLEEVMRMELMFDRSLTMTRCEILLPDSRITMTMPSEAKFDCDGKCKRACAMNCPYTAMGMVETPFGWVSEFALIGIMNFDNPVSSFYQHMGKQARKLHKLLEKHGIANSPVTSDILTKNQIHDPIKIHKCYNEWLGVEKFLRKKM